MKKHYQIIIALCCLLCMACSNKADQQQEQAPGKENTSGYRSIDDLRGKRVAVLLGGTHDSYLTKNYPDITVQRIEAQSDMPVALQSGRCEAMFIDNASYHTLSTNYPDQVILVESVFDERLGIGFSYKNLPLRDAFNSFLKELIDNGTYDEIYNRWVKNLSTATMPEINVPTTGKPIRSGISGTNAPFDIVKNEKEAGFEVELLMRFAEKMQRPIQFQKMNFGGLITALSAGKVDVISGGMTITEERVKTVAFSDSHFLSKSTLVVLKKDLAGATIENKDEVVTEAWYVRLKDSFYNNLVAEKRYMLIIDGLGITILISVMAAILGTLLGAFVCFLRMSRNKALNGVGRLYINLMRGLPVLVLLMLMYYVVFATWNINAAMVAIITFAMNFAGYVSEMFRASIEGVDRGQNEAGIALGFTKVQSFLHVVMPQAIKSVLPIYKGELISLVKMTSVVGYIAVEDLTKASDIIRSRTFDAFFPLIMVAVIYFALAWLFGAVLDYYNYKKISRK